MTTVKELREMINEIPADMDDCPVFMQKDPEGNGYRSLFGVDPKAVYVPYDEHLYEVDVYDSEWDADEMDMEEEDWDNLKKNNKCVVIWPA